MLAAMRQRLVEAALMLLATLVLLEGALQLAAWVVRPDRGDDAAASEGTLRILCAGDSHTLGAGVRSNGSYPAQLESRLAELYRPRKVRVFNVGVAGANTAYVANRLAEHLAESRPHALILWVGVNNKWNAAEASDREGFAAKLDSWLALSRVYRLVRVTLYTREEPEFARTRLRAWARRGKRVDRMLSDVPVQVAERRATADLESMVRTSRAAGVPVILIDYPWANAGYANRAIHAVGTELGVPVVSSAEVLERALQSHESKALVLWGAGPHPSALLYRKVVEALLPTLAAALSEAHGIEASGTTELSARPHPPRSAAAMASSSPSRSGPMGQ
jgi:lysophospholipase L1-like esterase